MLLAPTSRSQTLPSPRAFQTPLSNSSWRTHRIQLLLPALCHLLLHICQRFFKLLDSLSSPFKSILGRIDPPQHIRYHACLERLRFLAAPRPIIAVSNENIRDATTPSYSIAFYDFVCLHMPAIGLIHLLLRKPSNGR